MAIAPVPVKEATQGISTGAGGTTPIPTVKPRGTSPFSGGVSATGVKIGSNGLVQPSAGSLMYNACNGVIRPTY